MLINKTELVASKIGVLTSFLENLRNLISSKSSDVSISLPSFSVFGAENVPYAELVSDNGFSLSPGISLKKNQKFIIPTEQKYGDHKPWWYFRPF
jgi:hypothetical protein